MTTFPDYLASTRQRALRSSNARAVLNVAQALESMGLGRQTALRNHVEYLTHRRTWPKFGAMDMNIGFGVDITALQARLNALGASPPLDVDGIPGPKTTTAIKDFQSSHNIDADGIVGPITLAALGMTGTETPPKPSGGSGIIAVKGLETTSNAFRDKLVQVSNTLGINPDWLASAMSFETGGTFSPSVQNPYSKATGLIQFMSSTAKNLGTTIDALKAMTDIQQLDYVYQYFLPHKGRMRSLDDVYLAVFMPSQIGKSADSVVASSGSAVYEQNSGFDRGQKGYFTVGDVTGAVRAVYNAGLARGVIPVGVAIGMGLGTLLAIGGIVYLIFRGYSLFLHRGII